MSSRQTSTRAGLEASGDRHDRHEQPGHLGLYPLPDIRGVPELRGPVRPVHVGILPRTGAIMVGITFRRYPAGTRGSATGKTQES